MADDFREKTGQNSDDSAFADVDISNDFMFSYVFRDPQLCMELLEVLLPERKICKVMPLDERGEVISDAKVETQKTLDGAFDKRRVRLDVYVDDGTQIIDVEMQVARREKLPQRARLYGAHIDINQLGRGFNYDRLRPSFVIFLCKFDPFGQGLYRYSFENRCKEDGKINLNDESYKLFFNTTGTRGDISPGLRALLEYINDTSSFAVEDTDFDLIKKIEQAVQMAKMDDDWRHTYMMYQIQERDAELRGEQRGIAIGEERGKELGIAIGEQRGIGIGELNARLNIAREMLVNHVDEKMIAKVCSLPPERVLEIKAQLAIQ